MRINASEPAIANQGMKSIWCPNYRRSDSNESRSAKTIGATTTRE